MRKIVLLLLLVQSAVFAQRKNVALVTIYVDNRVNMDAFGKGAMFIAGPEGDFMFDMNSMVLQRATAFLIRPTVLLSCCLKNR